MITHEQLKNITERIGKLKGYLEIDKKLIEINNEEEKTVDPNFWNNPKEAEVLMKSLRFKKKWVRRLQLGNINERRSYYVCMIFIKKMELMILK